MQVVGLQRQPGDRRVDPPVEQGLARLVPLQVQRAYVGVGVLAPPE
ncbi:hypothetical protein [Microbispora sitophila]|nr:hypothetical protein [Microbispora sitophila]